MSPDDQQRRQDDQRTDGGRGEHEAPRPIPHDGDEHFHFRREIGEHEQPSWRQRARDSRTIRPFYRAGVLIVGLVVVAIGVLMLVFPGPGWAAIILGLVILASEFTWAERILAPIRRLAEAAADRALDPKRRKQNLILLFVAAVVLALLGWAYLARYGLTYEPIPGL